MTSPNQAHRFAPLPHHPRPRALADPRTTRTNAWALVLRSRNIPVPAGTRLFGVRVTR